MEKKGVSEMLKYILVLVGGLAILIFFISFGLKSSQIILHGTAIDVRETLNDYFNAVTSSGNLVTTADINTRVVTNYPSCGYLGINLAENKYDAARYSHIIFSPIVVSGKIDIWAREWKYPYRVATFFYLAGQTTKIYFVGGNSNLLNELACKRTATTSCPANSIDERFDIEKVSSIDVNTLGEEAKNKNIIVVYFNSQSPQQLNIPNVRTRSIRAEKCEDREDDTECRGTVNFGDKQLYFVGKAMLYGAIFAEDSKNYECGLNMAIKRLKLVSSVYDEKRRLYEKLKPNCGKYGFQINVDSTSSTTMYNTMKGLVESNSNLAGVECGKLF